MRQERRWGPPNALFIVRVTADCLSRHAFGCLYIFFYSLTYSFLVLFFFYWKIYSSPRNKKKSTWLMWNLNWRQFRFELTFQIYIVQIHPVSNQVQTLRFKTVCCCIASAALPSFPSFLIWCVQNEFNSHLNHGWWDDDEDSALCLKCLYLSRIVFQCAYILYIFSLINLF